MSVQTGSNLPEKNVEDKIKQLEEKIARLQNIEEKYESMEEKLAKYDNIEGKLNKLENITKARVKNRSKEEMDKLESFYNEHIVQKKGNMIKTVDVMTKVNEVLASKNLRFNKFEISKFMKEKGVLRKKGANHTFYLDIQII